MLPGLPKPESLPVAASLPANRAYRPPCPPDGISGCAGLPILFIERNGERRGEPAHVRDVSMVEAVASGKVGHDEIRARIEERLV